MDRLKSEKEDKFGIRVLIPRLFKALVKTVTVYILFTVFSTFIIPLKGVYTYQSLFTVFFALFLFFIFIIELTKDTIFQHIFSIANSLMIVLYFTYVLNTGIIHFSIDQVDLMIDLRFFLALFVLGGILGFAKSMLQFLNWMNEKEERWLKCQIKSL
ncbi:MAG: hypothetical protein ACE5KD_00840 [Candidatus Bathyarchaeia archaeon]